MCGNEDISTGAKWVGLYGWLVSTIPKTESDTMCFVYLPYLTYLQVKLYCDNLQYYVICIFYNQTIEILIYKDS